MADLIAPLASAGGLDLADARNAAALSLSRLQERLSDAFYAGRKANTVAAYRRDHEDFRAFLARQDGLAPYAGTAAEAVQTLVQLQHGQANALALGYRADLVERGLQPATVNRRLAALRSVVRLAKSMGLMAWTLDVENVDSAAYRDTRGPGRNGVQKMLRKVRGRHDHKGVRDTAIVRLLYDLALRRGEVVSLDLAHYDAERGTVAILGKGRTERETLTLPAATQTALAAWVAVRGERPGPLFHRLDRAGAGGRLTGTAVHQLVRELGAEVGLKTRPHGLRHAAITEALDRSNGNVRAVQKFSRHRNVEVVGRYDDNRSDQAGQMARLIAEE